MAKELLERIQMEGTGIIEGDMVTFVWYGEKAPKLMADFSDWERGIPVYLKQVKPGIWIHKVRLPSDAYMEYAYIDGEHRIPDQYNHNHTSNGIGDINHFFYMPDAVPTDLSRRVRGIVHGEVTHHSVQATNLVMGGKRSIYLYQPPAEELCPLLVVWDGQEFMRRAQLVNVLDNLINQERIRPVALAMVQSSKKTREVEYACSEATLDFLLNRVLPLAKKNLNLLDLIEYPGAFGVMGASMGGVMALYTGLRLPEIFGFVLSQSGAFSRFGCDYVVFELVREGKNKSINLWMDIGKYDFQTLIQANHRMCDLLVERAYNVTLNEYNAGHNYPAWRDNIWRGLEKLCGSDR